MVLSLELPRIDDKRQACLSCVFFLWCTFVRVDGRRKRSLKSPSFLKKLIWISRALNNEETVDAFSLLQRELAMTEKLVKQTLSKEPANELRFCAFLTN